MSQTPPPIRESEFLAVDIEDEPEIKRRFNSFIRSLHAYLNQLQCLSDVQRTRRRWKARTSETKAFGNFATDPKHWYTFHHGGRNEAQFNIGLYPTYARVGLGFEFTLKKGGDPTAVQLAYACFTNVIRNQQRQFERFVADNYLEIEWGEMFAEYKGGPPSFVSTHDVLPWLLSPPLEPGWIFIGRLLRRGQDTAVLENPVELGNATRSVLCGFRPFWEQTQVLAYTTA